jgi:hypothetical protein
MQNNTSNSSVSNSTPTLTANHNSSTHISFAFYAISTMKLLLNFNAFPYPQAPSLPPATASRPQSYLTLYQLAFSRQQIPPLSMLQFVDALDYMHINTPTTGYSSIPDPASGLALQPFTLPFQVHHVDHSTSPTPYIPHPRTHFSHIITVRGYTPLFLSSRHPHLYKHLRSLHFMLQNGAYVHTSDEDNRFTPLIAFVQYPNNPTIIQHILDTCGLNAVFTRTPTPSDTLKSNITNPNRFGVKKPPLQNTGLLKLTLPTEQNAGQYFGTTGAALRTGILEKLEMPSVFDPWFSSPPPSRSSDGFHYLPILSQQSRCIFEYAREEYIDLLKIAALKWKSDALREEENQHKFDQDEQVRNIMTINQGSTE